MTIRKKTPNKKQKERIDIIEITNQYFRKLLKEVKNPPYRVYKQKQIHNEPTGVYFFLINQMYSLIKSKKHVQISTKGARSEVDRTKHVNKTIGHVNKKIQSGTTPMNGK